MANQAHAIVIISADSLRNRLFCESTMTKDLSVLFFACFLSANTALGQISSATLLGNVTDATGSVISSAKVEVKNLGTDQTRSVATDSTGGYVFQDLPVAHYSLTITAPGFKAYVVRDLELQVAQRALIYAVLEVGAMGQEVTVAATAPILEAATSSIGQVVDTAAVERMPLNGRSFWQLTSLTPGATYTPGGQGTRTNGASIRSSAVNVTINGQAPNQTGWSLDGAFITEMQTGGTQIQPNVDALQEFRVEGANMMAEYGHTPNVVNATLKSGTNNWHGSAFEFLRNSALDARNFFYVPPTGSNSRLAPLRRNQYGFTLGAPIRHDKTFFFLDFERTGLLQGVDFNNAVPSNALRSGDFSELLRAAKPVVLIDPLTRQPFVGNIIPQSRLSPQGQFFLKYLPVANTVLGSTSYAALSNDLLLHQNRGDSRIDHQINASTQLMGRYSINDNQETDPNPFPSLGAFPLGSRAQNATVSLTHIYNSHWLSQARVSYYRDIFVFGATLEGTNFNRQAGVKGFDDTTSIYSFPQITLSNYATFTGSPSDQRPKSNRIRNWQYAGDTSYSSGKHSLKFGGELLHQTAGFFNGSRSVGIFNFLGAYTGNSFGDFLLGYPDSVTRDYFKQLNGDWANFGSFYLQDSYRVTPNLTLNLGVRLELNSFYNGIRGQKSAFDLQTGKVIIPSSIDPSVQPLTPTLLSLFGDRLLYTNNLKLPDSIHPMAYNWAPRVGFAWQPGGNQRLVIRSSYGIFYNFPDSNTIDNTVATVPFVAIQTAFNDRPPAAPSRTWADFFLGQPAVSANPNPGQPCSFGLTLTSCATPDIQGASRRFRSTSVQEWNFAVQRQITASSSIDLAYVGTKTAHLNQNLTINDPQPGPAAIQARRPYQQWGNITYTTFDENASYNAFQTKFEQRYSHGLTTLLSYAYSKCLDSGSSQGGTTITRQRFNRGVCDYDLPHAFTGSFDYELPFGRGRLYGGWEVAGIVTLRSGQAFTPTLSGDTANTGLSGQRPDVVGKPVIVGKPTCYFYISTNPGCVALSPNTPDAFVVPPAQLRYGNEGRNVLRTVGLKQVDFTVTKNFVITESKNFQIRAEMFNLLNHPTFAIPSTSINSSSGAQITSTLNAARIVQLSAKLRF